MNALGAALYYQVLPSHYGMGLLLLGGRKAARTLAIQFLAHVLDS